MSLLTIAQALEATDFGTYLRESSLAYPIVMTGHLVGIGLFGGMILMTDLRLLGIGMRSHTIADLVRGTRPWKHLGLMLVVGCGIALAWCEATKYYRNPFFHTKVTLLLLAIVHALVFRPKVYKNPEALDAMAELPGSAKLAAVLSILIWTGVATMGRLIAYWEPK